MMADSFKVDFSKMIENLGTLGVKTEIGLLQYAVTKASQLQSYMQINRPWTDRTGMAKATLTGKAKAIQNGARIELSYGVWYGIYLEKAHEEKYAIIGPTLKVKGPEVVEGAKSLLSKISL